MFFVSINVLYAYYCCSLCLINATSKQESIPLSRLALWASTGIAGSWRFFGDGVLVGDIPGIRTGVLVEECLLL